MIFEAFSIPDADDFNRAERFLKRFQKGCAMQTQDGIVCYNERCSLKPASSQQRTGIADEALTHKYRVLVPRQAYIQGSQN
jgi:hypothetical protein